MKTIRTYSELKKLESMDDRFEYLRLNGTVGRSTFGYDRYINQTLYNDPRYKSARDVVILRDDGCDLGIKGYKIQEKLTVHHMNPLTLEDIQQMKPEIFDPEYLICSSPNTHQAVHYGDKSLLPKLPIERRKNDTCPWKR